MKEKELKRLEKYYQGEEADSKFVEDLFENEEIELQLKDNLNSKWEDVVKYSSEKLDLRHILYKIHFNINSETVSQQNSGIRMLSNWVSKVAVILLIPLIAISTWLLITNYNQPIQYSEIVAPKGEKAQFVLPDGSTGYLNSGSTLKYAYPFTKKRQVELNGEAFFNVIHESDNSEFVVQVHGMRVKVHGTRFNICAYQDESQVATTLVEGSVSVIREADGGGVTVKPGQQVIYRKNNQQITYRTVDVDLYTSWKDNMLRFHNTPFADVVKKMERWYDVKIILEEDLKYTHSYTMTIKTESLREMLELMIVTTPMEYEIKEDKVYITKLKN